MTDETEKAPDPKVTEIADRLRRLVREKHQNEQQLARFAVGVREHAGEKKVALLVGDYVLYLTADQADELSADIRSYAIEIRNGGRLT